MRSQPRTPDPNPQPRRRSGRPRSWPEVQIPVTRGNITYEQALAAVREVKARRALPPQP